MATASITERKFKENDRVKLKKGTRGKYSKYHDVMIVEHYINTSLPVRSSGTFNIQPTNRLQCFWIIDDEYDNARFDENDLELVK